MTISTNTNTKLHLALEEVKELTSKVTELQKEKRELILQNRRNAIVNKLNNLLSAFGEQHISDGKKQAYFKAWHNMSDILCEYVELKYDTPIEKGTEQ